MKPFLQALFFVLLALNCRADEPRSQTNFKSKDGIYELQLLRTRKDTARKYINEAGKAIYPITSRWGMFIVATHKELYSFEESNDNIASKTALISDNGNRIAVLDDWSAGIPFYNYGVLSFYERGRKIKEYVLHDFLCSCGSISSSVSHFRWFVDYRFAPLTHSLTISTYELNTFVFDITSGQLLSKRQNPAVTNTSVLVSGLVQKIAHQHYKLTVEHRMHGTVPENGIVTFFSKKKIRPGAYLTLLIDNGQRIDAPGLYEEANLNSGTFKQERKLRQEVESMGGLKALTAEQKEFFLGISGCP
ncbi:hypothetical protein [Hymenobacter properus]|uniref:Uncharacterized protein n=1 Tax=Hymenobacter properus TaxID=2791026 RepID=A0A931BNC6_9BACT|nr:hypothetical protein [Hymenobacter properus]MBF9142585.1 hypothetical protein [Hymenobacter properus]MBR7721393.1 hypothetical protein [Microvirga sp. SRT04]